MTSGSTPSPLDRVELGHEGISYVTAALRRGLSLSRLLAGADLSAGDAYTLVPPGTPHPRLLRWSEGGLMASDLGLGALVAELRPLLQMPSAVLVAENSMARPEDEVIRRRSRGYFTHGQEVYEYRAAPSARDDIRSCLRTADAGYSLNAVVAEGVSPPSDVVSEDYLREISRAVRVLVTRAYDGEGFVLWRPATIGGADPS